MQIEQKWHSNISLNKHKAHMKKMTSNPLN